MLGPIVGEQFGEQVAAALLGIGFGLSRCWEYSPFQTKRRDGILDQEVDKFSLLLVHALRHADLRKAPFTVYPGRRGHGAALVTADGSPAYICDIIEDFQAQMPEEHHLFAVRRTSSARFFSPLVSPVDWATWADRSISKHPAERDFLGNFSTLVQAFEQPQIIALGRHVNKQATATALRRLSMAFRDEFQGMLSMWNTGVDGWFKRLREGCEIAEVGNEKVTSDRDAYSEARKSVARHSNTAADAILGCRPAEYEIWESPEVTALVPITKRNYMLSRIVRAAIESWAKRTGNSEFPVGPDPDVELQVALAKWVPGSTSLSSFVDHLREGRFEASSDALRSILLEA